LDYPEMVSRLRGCDIAVNPIVAGAAQSITNKVGDYAAAGLPVVNSQECEAYRTLLDSYGAGLSCDAGAPFIASAVEELASDDRVPARATGARPKAEEHVERGLTDRLLGRLMLEGGRDDADAAAEPPASAPPGIRHDPACAHRGGDRAGHSGAGARSSRPLHSCRRNRLRGPDWHRRVRRVALADPPAR